MNRKIILRFIIRAYALFAFCLLFNYWYVITNGLQSETIVDGIPPTAVSGNYIINAIVAITVISIFFYNKKKVRFNTRSIR